MKAKCIWLTGLPCSGKTTIAKELAKYFPNCQILDGDIIRDTPISKDVGFSPEDREKHIKRMGYLAKMFADQGITTICSFVSPSLKVRNEVRSYFKHPDFVEVYVNAPLDECIRRDVKGMYKKAISGEIKNFTGIHAKYEKPLYPEIVLKTLQDTLESCVQRILHYIEYYDQPKYSIFVGRWNGVFHNGHDYIIQKKLDEGANVLLLIRDVVPDEKNPWTSKEVKEMLDYRFKDNPKVKTIIIPDIESIEYGRGVGYAVNEIKVDKEIAGISGTKCRELIENKDDSWKKFVPTEIIEFLERKIK
jgi:adenylylsulfate kinase